MKTIILITLLISISCNKIEDFKLSQGEFINNDLGCGNEKYIFTQPDLFNLQEGIDYIIIRPNIIPSDQENQGNQILPNSFPCGSLQFPCVSWNTLIHNKLAINPTIKFILLTPGDYRCLGPLSFIDIPNGTPNWIGRELTESNKCNVPNLSIPIPNLSILFYDPSSADPFTPIETFSEITGNALRDHQVVLESFILDGSSNFYFRGIVFEPLIDVQYTNILKHFSDNNIIDKCKFINFYQVALNIRSSNLNIIQNCSFIHAKESCTDPVAIYIANDHNTRSQVYNTNDGIIFPSFSNKILDNLFKNSGQAVQTGYHPGESYPGGDPSPNNIINYSLATVANTLICGNIAFKTETNYSKYENDFTFKIGSQCFEKPVVFRNNYCWGNRTWNQQCGPNKSDGNIGDAVVIWGWATNIIIYNNFIDNSINGISGISLKTDEFFSFTKDYHWNIYNNFISNIITSDNSNIPHNSKDNRSAGFLWPGHYTLGNSLFLHNNTFYSVEDPTVIEDYAGNCPQPCNCIEPNFIPNYWGGVQTNTDFLTRINDVCPIWSNYLNSPTPNLYDPLLNYNFQPPSKAYLTFRSSFINEPNFCCCSSLF